MSFRRFFLVRLGWALIGVWVATVVIFLIFRVAARPPVNLPFEAEERAQEVFEPYFGRKDPMVVRYVQFLRDIVDDPRRRHSASR